MARKIAGAKFNVKTRSQVSPSVDPPGRQAAVGHQTVELRLWDIQECRRTTRVELHEA